MNFIRCLSASGFIPLRRILALLFFLIFSPSLVFAGLTIVNNGKAITVYRGKDGQVGAYLITDCDKLFKWCPEGGYWVLYATGTPKIRQMDILNDSTFEVGTGRRILTGTDEDGVIHAWSHFRVPNSPWDNPYGTDEYDWFMFDPKNYDAKGLVGGLDVWKVLDEHVVDPADPWYKYMPAGEKLVDEVNKRSVIWLVDRDQDLEKFTKWAQGDTNYFLALNRQYGNPPFYIYYFGENEDDDPNIDYYIDPDILPIAYENEMKKISATGRMVNETGPPPPPPLEAGEGAVDEVLVKQFSYDEEDKILWCIDDEGTPWEWSDLKQLWIKRNLKSEDDFGHLDELGLLLMQQDHFYVRTIYMDGVTTPRLIIFKDNLTMTLILSDMIKGYSLADLDWIIIEEKKRDHDFDHLLLRPKETPQKIVRVDDGKRIRENYYLERLLQKKYPTIVVDDNALGVYPAEHRRIRR